MNICVVGLGKIGLPLAVQFAEKGHRVIGVDVNASVVNAVRVGTAPITEEIDLPEKLASAVGSGLLSATTDTASAVGRCEAVVVIIPVLVDAAGIPDFANIDSAIRAISIAMRAGTLVSIESTVPVGTTRNRWAPLLEEGSGLSAGRDFHLIFSPERVFTGRMFADLRSYPKLVGGIDESSGLRGVQFWERVLDFEQRPDLVRPNGVWDLGSCEAAELAKLAETTYRDVNIGLANQFARFADQAGIDIYAVIDACNSQPYSHIHNPGIAVGGHCIPIYSQMYLWNDSSATLVQSAREINASMPSYAVYLLERAYGDLAGVRVLVLGAAYRGGVREMRFSGVFPVTEELKVRGAIPYVSDPLYDADSLADHGLTPYRGEVVTAAIVQTDHMEYADLSAADFLSVKVLVDGRRITNPALWGNVRHIVIGGGEM